MACSILPQEVSAPFGTLWLSANHALYVCQFGVSRSQWDRQFSALPAPVIPSISTAAACYTSLSCVALWRGSVPGSCECRELHSGSAPCWTSQNATGRVPRIPTRGQECAERCSREPCIPMSSEACRNIPCIRRCGPDLGGSWSWGSWVKG